MSTQCDESTCIFVVVQFTSVAVNCCLCDLLVACRVLTNKDDAIKLIRENKGGRFKAFSSRVEAEEFSKNVFGSSCLTQANETVAVFERFKIIIFVTVYVT